MGGAQDNADGTGPKNHYPVLTPGGGVDVKIAKAAAIRVRLDFPLFMRFGNDVYKGTRISAGLVVGLGH